MPGRRRRWAWAAGAALLLAAASLAFASWAKAGAELGRAHAQHLQSHPGWSFPARVYSPRVPLSAPPKRLIVEARLRGYREDCGKSPAPGTLCERLGRVTPREGDALEPLFIGRLIGPDAELREHLPLSEAPAHLLDAILVAEDREFREHRGVNLTAIGRALFANARERGFSQGGSTLSMQVVRALTQRTEKTLWRKAREASMAVGLDWALGKDGVLQMYLDAPYLGQRGSLSVCGFQAAARHYFDKDARRLDLAEAATLVAILPAPGKLAPDRDPAACRARRDRVLRAMAELRGYDVTAALARPVALAPPRPAVERFPAYLSAVRMQLEAELPREVVYGAGLVVETGMDLVAQSEAERLFPEKLRYFEQLVGRRGEQPLQALGIALDPETGLLRALWAGTDVTSTGFNRALQARRQPGSSFKPVVYALAMSQRRPDGGPAYTSATREPNSPRDFKTPDGIWRPTNVNGKYTPTASLAYGLAWSQNVATASLLEQLGGPGPLIAFSERLGFDTTSFPAEMGLALGQAEVVPVELAQFAALVVNGGRRVQARPVLRAVDAAGLERIHPPRPGERVMTTEAAALTRELMRLVVSYGTGGAIRGAGGEAGYGGPAIGKTGTTDDEKDLWFVGATPNLAALVWLGYDQPRRIGASASDLAAPLWGWWMRAMTSHDGPPPDFPGEPKLASVAICTETGLLPSPACQSLRAPFLPGTAPRKACEGEHDLADDEEPPQRARESLWKRLERAREELPGEPEEP